MISKYNIFYMPYYGSAKMQWIDTHVHLFSKNDSDNSEIPLLYGRQELNTQKVYFDVLGKKRPEAVVVVDFSKAKSSEHVINSLDELKANNIKAAGVIKADPEDDRTAIWMDREDVKAVRIYTRDSEPDLSGDKWRKIFTKVKENSQHILVFGSGKNLISLVKQIPDDITILVDHLGLPQVSAQGKDLDFAALLKIAANRKNIYFKGPGYRTSMDIQKVKPIIKEIVKDVGIDRLILGASDGPFAGPVLEESSKYEGKKFAEVMDYEKVIAFTAELADYISTDKRDREKLLFENAKEVYGF